VPTTYYCCCLDRDADNSLQVLAEKDDTYADLVDTLAENDAVGCKNVVAVILFRRCRPYLVEASGDTFAAAVETWPAVASLAVSFDTCAAVYVASYSFLSSFCVSLKVAAEAAPAV